MCGLVGLINKNTSGFSQQQQEVFNSLLFIDYLRGTDSTGIFLVDNRGDISLAKEASNPLDFMNTPQYNEIMKRTFSRGSTLIGHNRKATRGTVTDENAHPFVVDDKIVLVHNGTMFGDHKKIADVEVDSHAIAHAIHEKKDVTAALSSFDAAYALIWYDFDAKTMNFVRNSQRPLWWMETHNSWIWSSEKAMLEFVKARHNLHATDGPAELPGDTHQMFTLSQHGTWRATTSKLELKKEYPVVSQTQSFPKHPYSNVDMREDFNNFQDPPFEKVRPLPPITKYSSEALIKYEGDKIAKPNNKIVTNKQFHDYVLEHYKFGTEVHAISFDYALSNLVDESGGFWLYCALVDDPDIIVKAHFPKSQLMDENRMIQIASGEYVYKMIVGNRRWDSFSGSRTSDTPGYCVFTADKVTLVHGGGIGDVTWMEKMKAGRSVH